MNKTTAEKVLAAVFCMVACTCVANQIFSNSRNDWDFGNAQNWNAGKSIDYNGTETSTSAYDPQLVLNVQGHYKLTRDLTVLRCVADTGTNGKQIYFDFDDGVTFTTRGMANGSQAFGMNGGVNILFALTGGTFLVPEAYCTGSTTGTGYGSRVAYPRGSGNGERTTNVTFAVYNRTGAAAAFKTPLLQLNWGCNNLFAVSNGASAAIGTIELGGGLSASNGVLVASGGLFTLTNSTGILKIGGSGSGQCAHFTVADGWRASTVSISTQERDIFWRFGGQEPTSHFLARKGTSCRAAVTAWR